MSLVLHARAKDGVGLAQALALAAPALTAGGARAFALLYGARRCSLGLVRADGVVVEARAEADLREPYEARGFSARGELRWTHDGGGFGRAVYLSDDAVPDALRAAFGEDVPLAYEKRLEHGYVLWGQGTGEDAAEGWSVLSTARIGRILVPCDVPARAGVRLAGREYLACDDHGSAYVAEERLVGLEVVPAPEEREEASVGA
jgi:CRISPR-associated protein (TIGR03984 family)